MPFRNLKLFTYSTLLSGQKRVNSWQRQSERSVSLTPSWLREDVKEEEIPFKTVAPEFGSFKIVKPGNVSPRRKVPSTVQKPSYWATGSKGQDYGGGSNPERKSEDQICRLRDACQLTRSVLSMAVKQVKPGMTTDEIDEYLHNIIVSHGAYPSALNYQGFPKSLCTSVNNVACHGIPDDRPLEDGDIVNMDVMVYVNGYHGDCSETVLVGNVDATGRKLVDVTRECLQAGIHVCGPNVPFSRIGKAIQQHAEDNGVVVVPAFTGHGIGQYVHGPPDIYHFDYELARNDVMLPGMAFTIEPVIAQGMEEIVILDDGWTAVTVDNGRSAQFEQTILITEHGYEILTLDSKTLRNDNKVI